MFDKIKKNKKYFQWHGESGAGFIFLEVLIAVALVGIVFLLLMGIGVQALNISRTIETANRADSLLKEGMEQVRNFRDGTDWAIDGLGIASTGSANPHHVILDLLPSPHYHLEDGAQTIEEFTRSIVVDRVSRDPGTQNIESVYNAGNDDPDTRKVTIEMAQGSATYRLMAYFTNWQ